ncbi:uncharacterized protein LOC116847812 [Odontomachus brunneus]|uniref:uncharacterized protein LOC116847812 n=1 Tax=Odontomachus brunneus TaxID=486640 RepID=UPI0013F1FD4D|nr:uncharacterized protein LOC116847812 [Odontomachus brunneus]
MTSTIATVVIGCVAAGVTLITLPRFFKRTKFAKRSHELAVLQDAGWTKIGSIKELYAYPIIYSKENEVKECTFQEDGLVIESHGNKLRDKMFVIFDEDTQCVQSYRNLTAMLRLMVEVPSKDKICLKHDGNTLFLDLQNTVLKKPEAIECKIWNHANETLYYIECVDCGEEAAEWVSHTLIGKKCGLRLGYYRNKTLRTITLWETFGGLREIKDSLKKTIQQEMDNNKQLPIYTMVAQQSMEEVNKSLLRDKGAYDFSANFIITVKRPFDECQYKYFKIGNDVIICNVNPWQRPRINPIIIPNDLKLKLMPINCKVLKPGKVRVNDDVYVRTIADV